MSGDPTQLRLLFENLVSNALRFRRPEVLPEVRVEAREGTRPGRVAITVSDNGIGIPDQYREQVFGLFKRLHTREVYEGAGLGLTLCRRVVDGHGGTLEIEPDVEQGTVMKIELETA